MYPMSVVVNSLILHINGGFIPTVRVEWLQFVASCKCGSYECSGSLVVEFEVLRTRQRRGVCFFRSHAAVPRKFLVEVH